MAEEVVETTMFHVTRIVGKRREYLVGAKTDDNTWVGSRTEASGWDTEEGARNIANATHDARACIERYTTTASTSEPVYSVSPKWAT
jgi:hypothetical protein